MSKNAKQLFDRIKNDLRTLNQTRRDRLQVRLLADAVNTLCLLEVEMLRLENLHEQEVVRSENLTTGE
jgi:hypothetical protein